MQIRLTVQATRGGAAARGRDVIVTAPAGTTLGAVAGGLLDAAAAAASGGGTASGTGGTGVPVYAGHRLLDPDRTLLGEPPLVDGAVLSLGGPADPGHGRPPAAGAESAAESAAAVTSLRVVAGPDAGGVHLLHGGQIRIGRSADADVPLDDPDVSRLHCALTVAPDGRITVADLGSTNGTTVDGTAVGRTPVPLSADAVLRVGESALRIAAPPGRGGAEGAGAGSGAGTGAGAGGGGGAGLGAGSAEHSRVPEQRRPHEGGSTTSGLGGGWPAGGGAGTGHAAGDAAAGTGRDGHGRPGTYDDGTGGPYDAEGTRGGTARGAGAGHGDGRSGRRGAGAGRGPAEADRTHGGALAAHDGRTAPGDGDPRGSTAAGPGHGDDRWGSGTGTGAGPGHGDAVPNAPGTQDARRSAAADPGYDTDRNAPGPGDHGSAAAGGGHGDVPAGGPNAPGTGDRHGTAADHHGTGAAGHGHGDVPGGGRNAPGAGDRHSSRAADPGYGDTDRTPPRTADHRTAAAGPGYGDDGRSAPGAGDDPRGGARAAPGRSAPDAGAAYGAGRGTAAPGSGRARGRARAEGVREPDDAAPRRSGTPTRGTVVPPELGQRGGAAGTARRGAAASVPQPPRRGIRAWARRLGGREEAAALEAAAPAAAGAVPDRAGMAALHDRFPDAAAILLAALSNEAAYRPGFTAPVAGAPGATPAAYAYGPAPADRSGNTPAHHPAHPGDTAPEPPFTGPAADPARPGASGDGSRRLAFGRDAAHADALVLRLGTEFRAGGGTVPVTVDLRRAGSLALAGPRPRLAGLARSVVAQLAALHAPDSLELVLISADPNRPPESRVEDWSWAGWLPQVRPRQGQDCRLLLAYDREQAAARVGELQRRLEQPPPGVRSVLVVDGDPGTAAVRDAVARLAERGPAAGVHVVCLAETAPATPASPLTATYAAACEASPGFATCGAVGLLSGDVATGLRLLLRPAPPTTSPSSPSSPSSPAQPAAPPTETPYDTAHDSAHDTAATPASPATSYGTGRARLRGDGFPAPAEAAAGGGWFAAAASGQGAGGPAGTVDAVSAAWAERLARALAPYGERDDAEGAFGARRGGALPGAVRLLDELGLARATPTALTARWLEDRAGAPRVGAVLGAGPGGRLTADLAAGPLAVEGTARGGKSELLLSFAAALAAGEPPERLRLVLVDGAGRERGDALGAAADLPHVSGYLVATDPVRMREFAQELGAEFKRRAALYAPEGEPAPQGPAIPGPRAAGEPRPGGGAGDLQAPHSNTLRLRPQRAGGEAPGPGTTGDSGTAPGTGPGTPPGHGTGAGTASGTGAAPRHGTDAGTAAGTGTASGTGATPPYGTGPGAAPEAGTTGGTGTAAATGTGAGATARGGAGAAGPDGVTAHRQAGGATPPHGVRTPPPSGRRAAEAPPAVVVLVDDYDALVAPALGSPARPAAGSVVRVVEAIARDGGPLGMHLATASARPGKTAATAAVSAAAHHVVLGGDDAPPGRGLLCAAGAEPVPFQAARVTGRIPRTATARPTVVPLEWARMGSPPTSRPLRELGNGPTDLALLASALQRAAGSATTTRTPPP